MDARALPGKVRPMTEAEVWAAERDRVAARAARQPIPTPLPLLIIAFAVGAGVMWSALHG